MAEQLTKFELAGVSFDQKLSLADGVSLIRDPRTPPQLSAILNVLINAVAATSLIWLLLVYRTAAREQKTFVVLVIS